MTPPDPAASGPSGGSDTSDDPTGQLDPALLYHVVNTLGWPDLRPLQRATIGPVAAGHHTLVIAPTAAGKTEAAVFPLLSRMATEGWAPLSVLYICPLRALLNNLHPRMERYAGFVGRRAGLWHGDVGAAPRRKIVTDPPDVLLTTPESLESMLISARVDHRFLFANLRAVVVDEIHAFAGDDRGWHLLAVLERLAQVAGRDIQRVGLSATVGNPEALLSWLRGASPVEGRLVVPPSSPPRSETVPAPVWEPGPSDEPDVTADHVGSLDNTAIVIARLHRGEKRLVFCDSREGVESLALRLREQGVTTFLSHASLSVDERRQAEQAFAEATDCVIVATSTLELGIDVGDLDRVIQIDAPLSVAAFLQRLGRTGRRPGTTRNCLFLTTRKETLVHALGLTRLWSSGFVEPIVPPGEPLHLLAQQILATSLQERARGGVGRRTWPDEAARLPEFGRLAAMVGDALVDHLLSTGMLIDDQGLLSVGPEGERSFGFRHFTQLTTSFAAEPLLRVLHGRQDLGTVHPVSLERRDDRPSVIALGGRSWRIRQVDWRRRQVYVEAAEGGGRSRWMGAGRPRSAALCQSMQEVLAGGSAGASLTRRAEAALDDARGTYWWVKDSVTTVLTGDDRPPRWWTFAGGLANRHLCALLGDLVPRGARPDDLSIELMPGVGARQLNEMIAALPPDLPPAPVFADALEGLKFSACLPEPLAAQTLGHRFSDPTAVRTTLSLPIASAHMST